ncbi:redoxin domain-containing protein [Parapedobacter deserti]|uniref:Redoxin domain-containing protein n=1 Tax=Parapedobacter deserti TaxID=1912957 RepID=A0ABV7JS65_9SPHI
MKVINIAALFALLISPITVFCQSGDFIIKGKVGAASAGKFIKLYYEQDTIKIIDSVRIANGAFELRGTVSAPTLGKLSLEGEDTGDRIDLFLSKGTIRVQANDSLCHAKIRGTALADSHEKLARTLRPVDKKFVDGLNTFQNMPEGEAKKAYLKELLAGLDEYTHFKRETIHQFVIQNPTSYVALYHLDKTAQGRLANYETTFPFYDKLSPELKATVLGKQLGERLLRAKGEFTGKEYIDFVSTTPDGAKLSLKDVLAKNKYTLVDFWASWCGPCRKENPHVVKAYDAFKDKGFTVLSISLDEDPDRWKAAIAEDGMPWHHVSSLKGWKEPVAILYGVRAIPQNLLIDDQGTIVATNLRGETLFNKVKELLHH